MYGIGPKSSSLGVDLAKLSHGHKTAENGQALNNADLAPMNIPMKKNYRPRIKHNFTSDAESAIRAAPMYGKYAITN